MSTLLRKRSYVVATLLLIIVQALLLFIFFYLPFSLRSTCSSVSTIFPCQAHADAAHTLVQPDVTSNVDIDIKVDVHRETALSLGSDNDVNLHAHYELPSSPVADVQRLGFVLAYEALAAMQSDCQRAQLIFRCRGDISSSAFISDTWDNVRFDGYEALLHALRVAVASNRTLVIATSDACSSSIPSGDGFLLSCCRSTQLFEPISLCPAHPVKVLDYVSAFRPEIAIAYDPSRLCVAEESLWQKVELVLDEPISRWDLNQALATFAFRLVAPIQKTLMSIILALSKEVPHEAEVLPASAPFTLPSNTSFLSLHYPGFDSIRESQSGLIFSRWVPFSTYIDSLRRVAAETGVRRVLMTGINKQQFTQAKEQLAHLTINIMDAAAGWIPEEEGSPLNQLALRWLYLTLQAHSLRHIGSLYSPVTRLVDLLSSKSPVEEIGGMLPFTGCISTSPVYIPTSAFPSRSRHAFHPAIKHLIAPSFSASKTQQLILVVGTTSSGSKEMLQFLSHVGLEHDHNLSQLYTSLFLVKEVTSSLFVEHKKRLTEFLKDLSSTPRQPLLMELVTVDMNQREKALAHFSQPSLLAAIISRHGLNIQLKVLAVVRDPTAVHLRRMFGKPIALPNVWRAEWQWHYEAKNERDVAHSLNGELQNLDVSILRIVDYDEFFDVNSSPLREESALRVALYLNLNPSSLLSQLAKFIENGKAELHPFTHHGSNSQQSYLRELFISHSRFFMFNHSSPPYSQHTYDESQLLEVAIQRRSEASKVASKTIHTDIDIASFASYLHHHQYPADCTQAALFVFDGFGRWTDSTSVITQLWDLARALSLALATNRVLVLPQVSHGFLQHFELMSSCSLKHAELSLSDDGSLQTQSRPSPASSIRVAIGHAPVFEFSFLAAISPYHSMTANGFTRPVLGMREFVRQILYYLLSPQCAQISRAREETLSVWMPSRVAIPIENIVGVVSAVSSRLHMKTVHLVHASTDIGVTVSPYVSPASMAGGFTSKFESSWGYDDLYTQLNTLRILNVSAKNAGLQPTMSDICEASNSLMVISTARTEEGLFLSSLLASSRYYDLFGDTWLDSMQKLNHHTYTSSLLVSSIPALHKPFPRVEKKIFSDKLRFVFWKVRAITSGDKLLATLEYLIPLLKR